MSMCNCRAIGRRADFRESPDGASGARAQNLCELKNQPKNYAKSGAGPEGVRAFCSWNGACIRLFSKRTLPRRLGARRPRRDRGGWSGTTRSLFRRATGAAPDPKVFSMEIDYQTLLEGGKHWSFTARRGSGLLLEDVEGG